MDSDSVERLMDVLLQMKINFVHVTETLHQQTLEVRQQLENIFEAEKKSLEDCVVGIDQKLKECSMPVENYRSSYARLSTMRDKLIQLGNHPSPMPVPLPAGRFDEIVAWRLEKLRCEGKI